MHLCRVRGGGGCVLLFHHVLLLRVGGGHALLHRVLLRRVEGGRVRFAMMELDAMRSDTGGLFLTDIVKIR